jgi:hypothetical protein
MPMSTRCQKKEKKMTISVIQDDDREQVQQQRKGDAIFTHL